MHRPRTLRAGAIASDGKKLHEHELEVEFIDGTSESESLAQHDYIRTLMYADYLGEFRRFVFLLGEDDITGVVKAACDANPDK